MDRQSQFSKCGGFTLIELTIVILIMGIMTATVAPKYIDSTARFRGKSAAKRIQADLMYARQVAMNQGVSQEVNFSLPSNTYSMPTVPDPNGSATSYSVDLSSTAYPATIVAVDLGGTSIVIFDRHGQPDAGGYVTVESGSHQYSVNLNQVTGRTTVL